MTSPDPDPLDARPTTAIPAGGGGVHQPTAGADTADLDERLTAVTGALTAPEDRPGQRIMAREIARAVAARRPVVVQAGTGTGKTLAYLVPVATSGARVVVATATKALQDQLAHHDLPLVAASLPEGLDWAVLKGRSNYVCRQRLEELAEDTPQLDLEDLAPTVRDEVRRLAVWARSSPTGDQSELDWSPSARAWRAVSVGSEECPGAQRCPQGGSCFAEHARYRAQEAQVVVVNTHLYGLHVASGSTLLPDHDIVVFDEAHQVEDIMSDTVGVAIGPSRFTTLASAVRAVLAEPEIPQRILDTADGLDADLESRAGTRLSIPLPEDLADRLAGARLVVGEVLDTLRRIERDTDAVAQRRLRAQVLATRLAEELDAALAARDGQVAFVPSDPTSRRLELAPLDVGPTLAQRVWSEVTGVLTSATIPPGLPATLGLDADLEVIDVGSPFDHEHQGLLYCALGLPDVRDPGYVAASHDELVALITAAGGRTLSLFTSWRAMQAAALAVAERVPYRILTQRDLPKPALVRAFSEDENSCLFATAGFFQGVDIPGRTLSLVTLDRLPFPRPDDPLLSARRELHGPAAFARIDLPRAATLLAQAAGRLIRTREDRGVVAVLDRRLGTASYRWTLVRALPPLRRTRHRAEAEAFLAEITRD